MKKKDTGIRQRLIDMRQRWQKAKFTKATTFWIVVGTVLLVLYLGFDQAGWVTNDTALERADRTAQNAVVARLVPICVAQFNQDIEKESKLAEFKELATSTQRTAFVESQDWATMPGEDDPDNEVATDCAKQIKLINE